MSKRSWYEFKASANGQKETTLFLYDEIGGFGVSAANFVSDLKTVPADHRLVLRIHSPGGSVLDGNAIFTALKSHPGGVTTHIDGLAASMASVIALAGAPVQMASNGIMMIHNVSGMMAGDSEDMRKMADTMDKIQQTIENAYVAKTGLPVEQIREMMDAETWMCADEACDLGFVDEITGELAMAAQFDLSKFKNPPPNEPVVLAEPRQGALFDILQSAIAMFKKPTPEPAPSVVSESDKKISELESKISELTNQVSAAKWARENAEAERAKLEETAGVAAAAIETLAEIFNVESGTPITKESIEAEIDKRAHAKALEIAANQGAPPVPTTPAAATPKSAEEL